jgi:quercetin dioxygenase-like cupin family protein
MGEFHFIRNQGEERKCEPGTVILIEPQVEYKVNQISDNQGLICISWMEEQ